LDQIWRQISFGKAVNAKMSAVEDVTAAYDRGRHGRLRGGGRAGRQAAEGCRRSDGGRWFPGIRGPSRAPVLPLLGL